MKGFDAMKDIEWIFFDMGYTLVNEDAAHERRITIALERLAKLGVHDVTREQFWRAARKFGSQGEAPFPAAARHFWRSTARRWNTIWSAVSR